MTQLARDISTKEIVCIISIDPLWKDTDGQLHRWDFEVMGPDGVYYVDTSDIEMIYEVR